MVDEERSYKKISKAGEPLKWKQTITSTFEADVSESQLNIKLEGLRSSSLNIDSQIQSLNDQKSKIEDEIAEIEELLS